MLSKLYRRFVPERVRAPLWNLRTYLTSLTRSSRRVRGRYALAEVYKSLGRNTATATLPTGIKMVVDLRDEVIGLSLFSGREYEPGETTFVSSILRQGMTFVDIGANIGYYSLLAARLVGHSGRVIAFEPDPLNYQLLCSNLRINKYDNRVRAHNMALGTDRGEMTLWKSARNFGDHRIGGQTEGREGVLVAVDKLDAHAPTGTIDLLKIDVQGFESKVFRGMKNLLSSSPPTVILMEFWPSGIRAAGDCPEDVLAELIGYGYRLQLLDTVGTARPCTAEDVWSVIPKEAGETDAAYVNLALRHERFPLATDPGPRSTPKATAP